MPTNQEPEKEKLTVEQLLARIKNALADSGVKFGENVQAEDILQAALDTITSGSTRVASSLRHGREYGVSRQTIINVAAVEYGTGSAQHTMISTKEVYINGALREVGLRLLTDDEKLQLVL